MDKSRDSKLCRFSSGIEVASFVTSSGLLQRSWDVITSSHANIVCNIGVGLSWKVYKEENTNVTIIAIEATLPNSSNLQADLVLLFYKNHDKFDREILNYTINKAPLIVTGYGLGGTVASQLTISLFRSIASAKNRLLCITFGSPLIGSKKTQEAISSSSIWNSSFLHVVSHKDPLPTLFVTDTTSPYTPFGTFLLCFDAISTCSDNPDSVLEILKQIGTIPDQNQRFHWTEYGDIVENLNLKAICKDKDFSTPTEDMTRSGESVIRLQLQLQALGFTGSETSGISKQIKKKEGFIILPKELGLMDIDYYKKSSKFQNIGYYDSYKTKYSVSDHYEASLDYRKVTYYWKTMVEEADVKPRREDRTSELCWLYGGTYYRRKFEPLAIAEYYAEGGKDYINNKRSKHFKKLEEWSNEGNTEARSGLNIARRRNVGSISFLTLDSCFWAHVEEALLSCKELNDVTSSVSVKEEAFRKLLVFENYVYGQLKNYAVSPEIFLDGSSYMRWWNQYKKIKGSSYSSPLANFMSNASNYIVEYVGGYDFIENSDVEYFAGITYNFTENSEGTLEHVRGTYDFTENSEGTLEHVGGTYDFTENSEVTLAQSETQTLYHFLLKHLIPCCCPDF